MDTGNYCADILADLYRARRARKDAKEELRLLSEEIGVCNMPEDSDGLHDVCFREWPDPEDRDEWCDICKQKLPIWQKYHEAANRAGAALRACLMEGKYIAELKP